MNDPNTTTSPPAARRMTIMLWLCRAAALLLLVAGALAGLRTPSAGVDFPQYYLGGLMVREGHWEALYPVPIPDAAQNAGYPEASAMQPYYARRAADLGLGDTFRFAQPPPIALVLVPLALLPYSAARLVWLLLMTLCLWGAGLLSGGLYRLLVGRQTYAQGVIVLVSVLLPRAFLSVRLGNLSPLVALCLAWAAWAMLRRQAWRGGAALAKGILAKFTPGVVLPIALLRGQYRYGLACAAVLAAAILVTLPFSGTGPFREYLLVIAPTQTHPTLNWTNQTLWGALSETPAATRQLLLLAAKALQWTTLAAILMLLFLRRKSLQSPAPALAGILLLLCWVHIFGPITWAHYAAYFIPFTGCLWFHCRSLVTRLLAGLLAAVMFIPWIAVPLPAFLSGPLVKFSFLSGMAALALIAAAILLRPAPRSAPAP